MFGGKAMRRYDGGYYGDEQQERGTKKARIDMMGVIDPLYQKCALCEGIMRCFCEQLCSDVVYVILGFLYCNFDDILVISPATILAYSVDIANSMVYTWRGLDVVHDERFCHKLDRTRETVHRPIRSYLPNTASFNELVDSHDDNDPIKVLGNMLMVAHLQTGLESCEGIVRAVRGSDFHHLMESVIRSTEYSEREFFVKENLNPLPFVSVGQILWQVYALPEYVNERVEKIDDAELLALMQPHIEHGRILQRWETTGEFMLDLAGSGRFPLPASSIIRYVRGMSWEHFARNPTRRLGEICGNCITGHCASCYEEIRNRRDD